MKQNDKRATLPSGNDCLCIMILCHDTC